MNSVLPPCGAKTNPKWLRPLLSILRRLPGVRRIQFVAVPENDQCYEAYCNFDCNNSVSLWVITKAITQPHCDPKTHIPLYEPLSLTTEPWDDEKGNVGVYYQLRLPGTKKGRCELQVIVNVIQKNAQKTGFVR